MYFSKGTLKNPLEKNEYTPASKQSTFEESINHVKYTNLRILSLLYKIMGWLLLPFGLIFSYSLRERPVVAMGVALISIVILISFLALSEGIRALIDIEENTRVTTLTLLENYKKGNQKSDN